jgi:hypothetical protein
MGYAQLLTEEEFEQNIGEICDAAFTQAWMDGILLSPASQQAAPRVELSQEYDTWKLFDDDPKRAVILVMLGELKRDALSRRVWVLYSLIDRTGEEDDSTRLYSVFQSGVLKVFETKLFWDGRIPGTIL